MTRHISESTFQASSLYVGDLHPDATEGMLYELFSQTGTVLSIRICRDIITRRSLGYAYVNYQIREHAEQAIDRLNFENVHGKPIRIMWSHRNPALRRTNVGNIFLKNLHNSIDNKSLFDTFSEFGNILSCKVAYDANGCSRGYGFVHFDSEDAAVRAINATNGMLLNDKQVYVGKFVSRAERQKSILEDRKNYTNVFIKNFKGDFNDDTLRQYFEKYGKVMSAVVMKDEDGNSKGFGFVDFKNHKDAVKAVEGLNGKTVNNRELYVGRAQKKFERMNEIREGENNSVIRSSVGTNLYVKNLDDDISDDLLREAFAPHGEISNVKVMTVDGRSKGFGFVCYKSSEEAKKAVTEMNGRMLGTKILYVALAQRKDERRAQLARQFQARRMIPSVSSVGTPPPNKTVNGSFQSESNCYAAPIPGAHNMRCQGRPSQSTPRHPVAISPACFPMHTITTPHVTGLACPVAVPVALGNETLRNRSSINMPAIGQQTVYVPQAYPVTYGYDQTVYSSPSFASAPIPQTPLQQQDEPIESSLHVPGQEPLTARALAAASPLQQKQMLGERLFPIIREKQPQLVKEITGMLLEFDNSEILRLLESKNALLDKVEEIVAVLRTHQDKMSIRNRNCNTHASLSATGQNRIEEWQICESFNTGSTVHAVNA